MGFFKVDKILDAQIIQVSPKWSFRGVKGDTVSVFGYDNPETEEDRKKTMGLLGNLVLGRFVELRGGFLCNPDHPITCRVFRDSVDVSRFLSNKK